MLYSHARISFTLNSTLYRQVSRLSIFLTRKSKKVCLSINSEYANKDVPECNFPLCNLFEIFLSLYDVKADTYWYFWAKISSTGGLLDSVHCLNDTFIIGGDFWGVGREALLEF